MKAKSIQESLLEEILAFEDTSFLGFGGCLPNKNQSIKEISTGSGVGLREKARQARPLACSITQLEDQILRMRVRAAKMPAKHKGSHQISHQMRKQPKNIRTETSQEQPNPPINYSTIYTRRSSLDQSLYDKALREQSARKSWISRQKKQQAESELIECSYKPAINFMSKQIMNRVDRQEVHEKVRRKKEESIKKLVEEMELKEMRECSFTPNIEKSQKKLVKSVQVQRFTVEDQHGKKHSERNSVSIFDHLYEDSKTRKIKSKKLEESYIKDCSKKPSIDEISREITKNTNFEERRLIYEKKKLQKQMQMRQKQNKSLRDSYRPSINISSHHRKKQISIGQHLYLQSKRDPTPKPEKPSNQSTKVNKKSREVYQQRKTLVFYQLFKLLDARQSGFISINNLDLESLPREVVKIIYPLIEQLQVMQVQLQEHEFLHSLQNLFKSLTIHEKDILLGFIGGGGQKQQDLQQFKPRINNKSKLIASCNQRSQMSIYQFCSIKEVEREKLLEMERVEKSKRELDGCTFQPKIKINYRR